MIIEDYVSFETAKLLKEKGFSELTTKAYPYFEGKDYKYDISCPTLQMAMKWLLKEYNIFICILFLEESNGFGYTIENIVKKEYITTSKNSSYKEIEDAYEAAIKYCLENLI